MTQREADLIYHIWTLANQLEAITPFIAHGGRNTAILRELTGAMARSEKQFCRRKLAGTKYSIEGESNAHK